MNDRGLRILMIVLLAGLILVAALSPAPTGSGALATERWLAWDGFLFGVPVILAGCLLVGPRWAFMAGVMYATIGLAMDLSTAALELSDPHTRAEVLRVTALTGTINFLLILVGGSGFLSAEPAETRPVQSRRS